jgi:hypothetical protein
MLPLSHFLIVGAGAAGLMTALIKRTAIIDTYDYAATEFEDEDRPRCTGQPYEQRNGDLISAENAIKAANDQPEWRPARD